MSGNPPVDVQQFGQSIWSDNISRDLILSGDLKKLIDESGVLGVTSNPTIFEKAIGGGTAYDDSIRAMVELNPSSIFDRLSIDDIQRAADVLRPVFDHTHGLDGYVSLEVSPLLANDSETTASEAKRLFQTVNRPNVMIKIPGTEAGLPAIEEALYAGVNINVTLLFAVDNYVQVVERYIRALERRLDEDKPVDQISSVASFFLSRIDTLVDKQLENNIRMAQGRDIDRVTANRELLGKAAIANAKVAYKRYQEFFHGERFARLRAAGARVQRPLWASTGTKNPAYPDTMYLDQLIGPETVNTVPLATLAAFKDHGTVAPTLEQGLDQAQIVLDKLAEVGVNLDRITHQLQEDGVESFIDSFNKLIAGVRGKVRLLKSGIMERQLVVLGEYQLLVEAAIAKLDSEKAIKRIWSRDGTLWKHDVGELNDISPWLGWLSVVNDGRLDRPRLHALQAWSKAHGWQHVVLLAVGGSSLAADVLGHVFGSQPGYPNLLVLDSTDPQAIQTVERTISLEKTLFIVASRSGATLETLALQRYFYAKFTANAGDHFLAITDPGSKLDGLATELKFAAVFLNMADIVGRYSALSYFGLVPAALIGLDLDKLLTAAEQMQKSCEPMVMTHSHPGIWLGAVMGALGLRGRDKVSLVCGPGLESFGAWAEQLIAESTGKEGKGLIPVAGATIGHPHDYDDDRLFIYLRLATSLANPDDEVRALQEAGHPLVTLTLRDKFDIGQEFYRWEFATAIAAQLLGVNPFNQPNVAESRDNTNRLLDAYSMQVRLPQQDSILTEDNVSLFANAEMAKLLGELIAQRGYNPAQLSSYLAVFFDLAHSGEYIGLMAYLANTAAHADLLGEMRRRIRHTFKRATTLGFGPRYLHSTGQLHKGGPNHAVFIQITVTDDSDPKIPQSPYGFSTLKQAQAAGDLLALQQHGRRVVRLHIGENIDAGLRKIEDAVKAAEDKRK